MRLFPQATLLSLILLISPSSAAENHWAFRSIADPTPPHPSADEQVRSPVDAFISATLREHELSFAPEADRRTLIRRVSYTLTGLPPAPEEVDRFVNDPDPGAYEKLVERLLASPSYGERWARHWLDVARYADTKGYVFTADRDYKYAYTYRDYVIRSFNEDRPYDEFILHQLAADRLELGEDHTPHAAMGFLTLGRRFLNNKHDIIDDRIDVVTRGLLGLTVTCARCHDHKYDPIPTEDYYSLYGVFASSREPDDLPSIGGDERAMVLTDSRRLFDPYVFERGSSRNRGQSVPRRFLAVLSDEERKPFTDGSGRLELAQAIGSPDNPLTARVMVNRVWAHHFGAGLVTTPSDFGVRSEPPSHPELLDWLSQRFIESGWSIKELQRLIVLSRAYRQSSERRPEVDEIDPDNRLLSRFPRHRLDWEAMRDGLLAVAGRLNRNIGGPSVDLFKAPFPTRRALYGHIDRQNLPGTLRAFDFAIPDTHCPQRFVTTVPQQTLYLLNNEFVLEQAKALIAQREIASESDPEQRIIALYRILFGREPDAEEMALGKEYIADDDSRWARYAQVLMMSNEFNFVD